VAHNRSVSSSARRAEAQQGPRQVEEIVGLLFQAVGLLQDHFASCAASCGLSVAQAAAIQQMRGPLTMRELADRIGCDPSNVTGITDRLEARALVVRQLDPSDRRIKMLVLTSAGAELRGRLQEQLLNRPAPITGLNREEQDQLRDLLQRALPAAREQPGS